MNMIFAELIMALFGVPVNFTAAIQHGWTLGETWCHAHGFFLTLESKYQFSTLLSYSTENQISDISKSVAYNHSVIAVLS